MARHDGEDYFFHQKQKLHTTTDNGVVERANAIDGDADGVAGFKGEFVAGYDTGAGEQQHAVGEEIVAAEVVHQVGQVPYDFAGADAAAKDEVAGTVDFD